jgi:cell division protein ZapA
MDKLSIKIKISDREYPMRVDPADEEMIRKAGKLINERIKSYRDKFGIDDKQDLLAMVAFDSTVDKMRAQTDVETTDETLVEKARQLNNLLSQTI